MRKVAILASLPITIQDC